MGCGESKHAVSTQNVLTPNKSKSRSFKDNSKGCENVKSDGSQSVIEQKGACEKDEGIGTGKMDANESGIVVFQEDKKPIKAEEEKGEKDEGNGTGKMAAFESGIAASQEDKKTIKTEEITISEQQEEKIINETGEKTEEKETTDEENKHFAEDLQEEQNKAIANNEEPSSSSKTAAEIEKPEESTIETNPNEETEGAISMKAEVAEVEAFSIGEEEKPSESQTGDLVVTASMAAEEKLNSEAV